MSLRAKTLLTVGSVIVCLVIVLYTSIALIVPPSFAALEQQHVHHDMAQVVALLANEQAALKATAVDWAAWDDTYQFVEDGSPAYVADNLADETFANLRLNLMLFVDRSGQVVFGKQFDLARGVGGLPPAGLVSYLTSVSPLVDRSYPVDGRAGLLVLPEGTLLVAVHPILTSALTGPPGGTLVLGRWLDPVEVARLSGPAPHPFELVRLDAAEPADVQTIRGALSPTTSVSSFPLDDDQVAGYALLDDITGAPALIARSLQPRTIVQQGRTAMAALAGALMVAGLAFGVTALQLVEHQILRRLARVEDGVRQIQVDDRVRVQVEGQDELARLATALNQALDALHESRRQLEVSEARYRAVVENQTELICRWRPDHTLTFTNAAYRRAFQALRPAQHLVPMLAVAEDRERVGEHFAQLRAQLGSAVLEVRVALPGGGTRWQQWVDRPIIDAEGQLVEFQSVGRDITERKQAEAEQSRQERRMLEAQRRESLGALAAGVAHEFNNLLAIMLGNSGLLLHDLAAGSPLRRSAERIEQAARRAADLNQQLVAYGGQGRTLVQPLDLNVIVADLQPLLATSIAKGVTLTYNLAPGRLPILADGGQIRQAILNLVFNAAEALGYGDGEITLKTGLQLVDRAGLDRALLGELRSPGDYICLEVGDTGDGIDPAIAERIFEPFFTTKLGGHGLGLAAVLGIVRAHDGALSVSSAPWAGTTFRVLLPRTDLPLPAAWQPMPVESAWRGQGTVIVIDDEPAIGEMVAAMLARLGFTPRLAPDGAVGLQLLRDDPFGTACVLLDLANGPAESDDVIRALRVVRPDLPVVVMSSFDRALVLGELGAVVSAVLPKPFDAEMLRLTLREVLEGE